MKRSTTVLLVLVLAVAAAGTAYYLQRKKDDEERVKKAIATIVAGDGPKPLLNEGVALPVMSEGVVGPSYEPTIAHSSLPAFPVM